MVKVELIIVEHDGRVRHALWQNSSLIAEDSVLDIDGETFRVHRVIENAAVENPAVENPAVGFDAVALLVEPEDRLTFKSTDKTGKS